MLDCEALRDAFSARMSDAPGVLPGESPEEVRTGRIDPDDAPWFIDAILLPAFAPTATTQGDG